MIYNVDPNSKKIQIVGQLPAQITEKYQLSCSSNEVHMHPGVITHLKKRDRINLFYTYHQEIPGIIHSPDYVGQSPTEPNSVELYKEIDFNLLVAIKLDPTGYLFLSTFYDLHNSHHKIRKRLNSGRIVLFNSIK